MKATRQLTATDVQRSVNPLKSVTHEREQESERELLYAHIWQY